MCKRKKKRQKDREREREKKGRDREREREERERQRDRTEKALRKLNSIEGLFFLLQKEKRPVWSLRHTAVGMGAQLPDLATGYNDDHIIRSCLERSRKI